MFNISDIVRRDAATYYDYGSSERVNRLKTVLLFATISVFLSALVGRASNEFLSGALSAQAILVGFSFNVLFYLVANRLTRPVIFDSIEHELRFERLSKLSDEVFDNVTYFNLVAISSALVALLLLLSASNTFEQHLHDVAEFAARHSRTQLLGFAWAKCITLTGALAALIFLLLESVFTFVRTVGRVRFYFGMLKTMNDESVQS